jgi:Carboxypeptidase regulatory-like domain/TonB-dependent Receptor Plug Domain/TonB dependent receptor
MSRDRSAAKWFRSFGYITLTALCFLLVQSSRAFGQVDEGSITGAVQDTSGAVVANAHVTLLNTDQGLTLETNTNSSGVYTFSPVRIGNYSISVAAAGFAKVTQEHLEVHVSQNLQVNLQLKPGSASETIEVTTAPPVLQTEDASVGQVVGSRTVNSLPLNGRNFTFLAQLGAGVNTPQADTRGNAASGAFSANGLRPAQNNYLLDGIDNNSNAVDFLNGTNFVILPPLDAIQEFKVQTADFSAEYGRSAGAVLNATIKSGTNSIHGNVWEFFRNDKLDSADYFETNGKGTLRLNQFGGTFGGPIVKNKLFIFGDYEGLRRVQGSVQPASSVPTAEERNSGYTDLSQLIQPGAATAQDTLGRNILAGTVLDPATTRQAAGGYVRDPFGLSTCSDQNNPTPASCSGLNQIPAGRMDPNAIKMLNLFPSPTSSSVSSNFISSPSTYEHRNAFDVRGDYAPEQNDQVFVRFSYVDDPQFIPGPFGGIADGGAFQEGIQTAKSAQPVAGWTHVFTPSTVNVVHVGWNHLHTTRNNPNGNTMGIPAQFGIQGVPQVAENGGLPALTFGGLSTLGSNGYQPSDEISQTLQVTDDFTKIYGNHSFKMGIEFQNVDFSTLQPEYSRGTFDYDGEFTDVPGKNSSTTGIAQFLLDPITSTAGGPDFVGGIDQLQASNINKTYDEKKYFATYFQDDWKVTPNMTLNLGLRWDYFGPINETNGGQANFIQSGPPNEGPIYLIPASGKDNRSLSSTATNMALAGNGFLDLLQKDGITLVQTDKYGQGLLQTQKHNFAPRFGLAYQINPRLVVRGGAGLSYNAFENQGYGPNIGENYPFTFNFNYEQTNIGIPGAAPLGAGTPFAGCSTAVNSAGVVTGTSTTEAGLSCLAFSPLDVNASQLSLQGLQFNYITPRTFSTNLAVQYSITHTLSAQVRYVLTDGSSLQAGIGNNNVTQLLPANTSTTNFRPFPDFNQGGSYQRTIGSSIYNGLQTQLEQQLSNGLNYLFTYTYSKTLSDAGDLLNGGSVNGYRAPTLPAFGIRKDWGPADFDLRNVFHFSGGYELPFGRNKHFLANSGKLANAVAGGWSVNWIATLQGGQPLSLSCPIGTTSGTSCNAIDVPGQSQKLGLHIDSQGKLNWFGNPKAFAQPCQLGPGNLPIPDSPSGCIPLADYGALGAAPGTTLGPGFHRLDFSTFKAFHLSERYSMLFRAEFFNILNHPNFNAPNFSGNGVVAVPNSGNFTNANFGEIGSTRDAPYDPRQIQFALKLYY